MKASIAILSFGFISQSGWGGTEKKFHKQTPPLDWKNFSQTPYPRFGRLDLLSKYALIAAELASPEKFLTAEPREKIAVCLGTDLGCLDVDCDFHDTAKLNSPSPKLFSYTLPSIGIGEISIRYKITGPCFCVMSGAESGIQALWQSYRLIGSGAAEQCLCIGASAFEPENESGNRRGSFQKTFGERLDQRYGFAFTLGRANAKQKIILEKNNSVQNKITQTLPMFQSLCELFQNPSEAKNLEISAPAVLSSSQSLFARRVENE